LAFNRAIAIDSQYGKAMYGKAVTLRNLGMLDDSIKVVYDILQIYQSTEAEQLKAELMKAGAKINVPSVNREVLQDSLRYCCSDILRSNQLLLDDGSAPIVEEIYQPEEFAKSVLAYCKKKYAAFGEQKIRSECIITSFYGAICATIFFYRDKAGMSATTNYSYLNEHIDIEFADVNAERLLGTKAGEEKAEGIWNLITPFIEYSHDIFRREWELSDELILEAMKNAYKIGMLVAVHDQTIINQQTLGQTVAGTNILSDVIDNASVNENTGGYRIVKSIRKKRTKGVPADYFFPGDNNNPSGVLKILSPLTIDCEKAVKDGIEGKNSWDPTLCKLIAENEKYTFYNYGCFEDSSGGVNIRKSNSNPKDVVFFGKARTYSCIFHNHLVQVDSSVHSGHQYLWIRHIDTGVEQIFPWFEPDDGSTISAFIKDYVQDMRLDSAEDKLIISVSRKPCSFVNAENEENPWYNIECTYSLVVSCENDRFIGRAIFDSEKTIIVFE
jgi:hypothetical protein